MVGVILNLAVWFGRKVILPDGGVELFAAVSAAVYIIPSDTWRRYGPRA